VEDAQEGCVRRSPAAIFAGEGGRQTMKRNSTTSSVSKKAYTERLSTISGLDAPRCLLPPAIVENAQMII
jgi:hypothetical protein